MVLLLSPNLKWYQKLEQTEILRPDDEYKLTTTGSNVRLDDPLNEENSAVKANLKKENQPESSQQFVQTCYFH